MEEKSREFAEKGNEIYAKAWKRSRIIVDTGGGQGSRGTPPTPPA